VIRSSDHIQQPVSGVLIGDLLREAPELVTLLTHFNSLFSLVLVIHIAFDAHKV
jgi:hypothetical protein